MPADDIYFPSTSLRARLQRRLVRVRGRRPLVGRVERPMISFTFDDGHVSAVGVGADILNAAGVAGTFFIVGGLLEHDDRHAGWDDIARLRAKGHEIGCHTFSHIDCGAAPCSEVMSDIARNSDAFIDHGLAAPTTFAYPFGSVSLATKVAIAPHFALMRGVHSGLIERGSDLNQTPAIGVQGDQGEAIARLWLSRALDKPAWLILFTHDVQNVPSPWGSTPGAIARLVELALGVDMDVVTVAEGVRRLTQACREAGASR